MEKDKKIFRVSDEKDLWCHVLFRIINVEECQHAKLWKMFKHKCTWFVNTKYQLNKVSLYNQ